MRLALARTVFALFFVVANSTSTSAQESPAAPSASPERTRLTVAVLPLVSEGVDPIVPRRVVESVFATLQELGYDIAPDVALIRALNSVHAATPPTPAEVWRVTVLAGAERGLAIRIRVENSLYVAELFVASADGAGPFRAEVRGDGSTFLPSVVETLRATMPTPATFDAESARRFSVGFASSPATQAPPSWSTATYERPPSNRGPVPQRRYGLTFVSESALGRYQGQRYYNHILGARIDFTVGENIVIGLFSGYVNLDLGSDRGSNFVFFAQLEDRLQFMATGRIRFPLKVAFGYVPFNGPFLRFSGGIRFPVGDRFEIGLDLLAPTFWWVPNDRRVTYDLGAELTYRFGRTR